MGYLLTIVGLVVFVAVAAALVFFLRGGGTRGPQEFGRETRAREDRPQAEREQMEQPQEEFVDDQRPPSQLDR